MKKLLRPFEGEGFWASVGITLLLGFFSVIALVLGGGILSLLVMLLVKFPVILLFVAPIPILGFAAAHVMDYLDRKTAENAKSR